MSFGKGSRRSSPRRGQSREPSPRRRLPRSPPLPPIDPALWKAREDETRHDVAAFVDVLAAACREHGRWVYYRLTSSDILGTSLVGRMQEASPPASRTTHHAVHLGAAACALSPHDGHGGADPRHVGGADNLRSQACRIRLRAVALVSPAPVCGAFRRVRQDQRTGRNPLDRAGIG